MAEPASKSEFPNALKLVDGFGSGPFAYLPELGERNVEAYAAVDANHSWP